MSKDVSPFLNLPLELRIEIYSHALIQHQPKIPLRLKRSTVSFFPRANGPIYTKRPEAFLITDTSSSGHGPILVCPLAISQTNRQIRTEFSDFLRTAPVDIVTKVQNFDCSNVITFINCSPKWRQGHFLVRQDGTAHSTLYLELKGPYSPDLRSHLLCWISFVEKWAHGSNDELKAMHKVVKDSPTTGQQGSLCHGEVGRRLGPIYQSQRKGAGRLELDKIYVTYVN